MASPFARPSYEILSPRLIIRTATELDTEAFHKLLTTPENFPHESPEKDLTPEKLRTRIGGFGESTARGQNAWVVFCLRETGELIGHGGYNTFELVEPGQFLGYKSGSSTHSGPEKPMTDLGIMIDHRHWRKGYGLEILCALIEYARGLGCELFRTETGDDNEPWKALMQAAGLGGCKGRGPASYDEKLEVWNWKFDVDQWEQTKKDLEADGKWPL